MKFDSEEEKHFYWYLLELQDLGIVKNIQRSESFTLCEAVYSKNKTLFEDVVYTPDFKCEVLKEKNLFQPFSNPMVSSRARKETRLTFNDEINIAYFEVKPIIDVRGKTTEVNLKRKWLYLRHKVFVELVKIPGSSNKGSHLFKKTFTPIKYLSTPTGKQRKINYEFKSIREYFK